MNYSSKVNPQVHSVVVVIEGDATGFISLHRAIRFIEETYLGEQAVKIFNAIATAMSDDKEDDFQIFDIDTYADLFMDEDEAEDDE